MSGQVSKIFKDKKEVELESKGVKIIVPVNDVVPPDIETKSERIKEVVSMGTPVVNEIDVRGMTAEDAVLEVERYLDVALNTDWQELRIIHGKGTGVLRQRIHGYLKKNKNVATFRLGRVGEGDTGVTIVGRN